MNTLVRSTTSTLSRRFDGYEPLDQRRRRTFSRRRNEEEEQQPTSIAASFSYRRRRAKQRQIFLSSYKLSSLENFGRSEPPAKVVVKFKNAVVSLVSLMRIGSLSSSCSCRTSAICAVSSPSPIKNYRWLLTFSVSSWLLTFDLLVSTLLSNPEVSVDQIHTIKQWYYGNIIKLKSMKNNSIWIPIDSLQKKIPLFPSCLMSKKDN